jgi:hypothetical protein
MTKPHLYQVEDGWIEIYPGDQFHFASPRPGEIRVESVAHSLSQLCRYNGHTRRFYSVAEHVCLMSDWVMRQPWATPRDGLTALHHDDAEYIIGDLARPVKVTMPQFKATETVLDEAIAEEFGTIFPFPAWLKDADNRILKDERRAVMVPSPHDWGVDVLEELGVRFWWVLGRFSWVAKRRYLRRHHRLWDLAHRGAAG